MLPSDRESRHPDVMPSRRSTRGALSRITRYYVKITASLFRGSYATVSPKGRRNGERKLHGRRPAIALLPDRVSLMTSQSDLLGRNVAIPLLWNRSSWESSPRAVCGMRKICVYSDDHAVDRAARVSIARKLMAVSMKVLRQLCDPVCDQVCVNV